MMIPIYHRSSPNPPSPFSPAPREIRQSWLNFYFRNPLPRAKQSPLPSSFFHWGILPANVSCINLKPPESSWGADAIGGALTGRALYTFFSAGRRSERHDLLPYQWQPELSNIRHQLRCRAALPPPEAMICAPTTSTRRRSTSSSPSVGLRNDLRTPSSSTSAVMTNN